MDEEAGRARFPSRVYAHGEDPDARFTLANERTFLAWIRTSLALLAGGVALESLSLGLEPGLRRAAAIVLIVAGLAGPVQAWWGWTASESALRRRRPLPPPRLAAPVAVAVLVASALVLLAVVL